MPKKKLSLFRETIVDSKQFHLVISSGIKVYPISRQVASQTFKHYIQVDNNGKITTYNKEVPQRELNDAIAKTIIHLYNQLIESKDEKNTHK